MARSLQTSALMWDYCWDEALPQEHLPLSGREHMSQVSKVHAYAYTLTIDPSCLDLFSIIEHLQVGHGWWQDIKFSGQGSDMGWAGEHTNTTLVDTDNEAVLDSIRLDASRIFQEHTTTLQTVMPKTLEVHINFGTFNMDRLFLCRETV